jgi:hypothetical protein
MNGDSTPPTEYFSPEAWNYEPEKDDIYIVVPTGQMQRLIFHTAVELFPEEKAAWEKFLKYLKDNGHTLPAIYDDDKRDGFRFLSANQLNVEKTWVEI